MRKIILLTILALLATIPASALVRNVQDNHDVIYHIIDSSGDHVTSQTVTLMIRRNSDGYFLDFNDSTFKNTGWTNKTTNLSEDSTNGLYYYTFNPPSSETGAEEYTFIVDNSDATYGDHQSETIAYQNIGTSGFDYTSNQVIVATNNDKTGYSISGSKTTLDALNDIAATDVWVAGTRTLSANTNLNDPTAAAIADAIWDETQSGHVTAGTFGYYLDSQVSAAGGGGLTVGGIADAVWDEAISGHLSVGTTGASLNAAGSAGDPWSTSYPGAYGAGTFGGTIVNINDATDGDQESGSYTGVENTIRRNR